ncbi:MAG: hypothetical protein HY716_05245 [Planctomycetes bacterium]|nr:hypothetical protein [Planctomycetota bacterium]
MRYFGAIAALLLVAPRANAQDAKEEFAEAAKKAGAFASYAFEGQTEIELPDMFGAAAGDLEPQKFEGKFQKDAGTYLRTATHEYVIIDGKIAMRPLAEWKRVEEDEKDPAAQGRMIQRLFQGLGFKPMKSPHDLLSKLGAKIKKAKKLDKKEAIGDVECAVLEADLTDDGARQALEDMMPSGRFMGAMGEAEYSGNAKLWVDPEGRIVKYLIKGTMTRNAGGMELEWSAHRTVTLSDNGSTTVEIPEAAKNAIEKKK